MKSEKYRFCGKEKVKLKEMATDASQDKVKKDEILAAFEKNLARMEEVQNKYYADGREGMIVIVQALDAAGKDSTIRRVAAGFNPQGVYVHDFKQPSEEELRHDYLWRINKALPRRGDIAFFNRSYYEDVLTVNIHDYWKQYKMADRVLKTDKEEFFRKRYKQIRQYEEYLYENSYRLVKIFLHVSSKEQKKRFLERIDRPEKNWKFSAGDLKDRELFDDYQRLIGEVMTETATEYCPWYLLPADQKWYTRYLVSEIILAELEKADPAYPVLTEEEQRNLAACKEKLLAENEKH